jgi:hypothetical protein
MQVPWQDSGEVEARRGEAMRYQEVLGRMADHLVYQGAEQLWIAELDGGYLLVYCVGGGQAVDTLTYEQIAALPALPPAGRLTTVQRHLRQIGGYLDRHAALSPLVAQVEQGYYVEYSAPPGGMHSAARLVRTGHLFDAQVLARLTGTGSL